MLKEQSREDTVRRVGGWENLRTGNSKMNIKSGKMIMKTDNFEVNPLQGNHFAFILSRDMNVDQASIIRIEFKHNILKTINNN